MAIFNKVRIKKKEKSQNKEFYSLSSIPRHKRMWIRFKRIVLKLFVFVCLGGALLALIVSTRIPYYEFPDDVATEQAFIHEYLDVLFSSNEILTKQEYLIKFQLGEWSLSIKEGIKLKNVDVYYQERINNEITRYYMILTLTDEKTATTQASFIEVARINNAFLVTSPLQFTETTYSAIEAKNKFRDEFVSSSMTPMSDQEVKNTTSFIQLFLETYNTDLDKAKTMVTVPDELIQRVGASYDVSTIQLISTYKKGKSFYIVLSVVERTDLLSTSRTLNILINSEKNQIERMDVK